MLRKSRPIYYENFRKIIKKIYPVSIKAPSIKNSNCGDKANIFVRNIKLPEVKVTNLCGRNHLISFKNIQRIQIFMFQKHLCAIT